MRKRPNQIDFFARPGNVCLLLAMATAVFVLFWPVYGFESITYDDEDYFSGNPQVQDGLSWQGIRWAFSTGTAANWHPLTWISLMFDVSFFASGSPAGPHVTNVVYHAANSILLFLLLRRLTGSHWPSAFAAGLFAIHPLNVESVAWISERKNVLSTFFWLLSLLAYGRYVEERQRQESGNPQTPPALFYGLALAAFACGLMSKPMLVSLPLILLLLDSWPLGRWQASLLVDWRERLPRLAWEKAPFFVLAIITGVVTYVVQGKAVQTFVQYPLSGRMENAVIAYNRYLGKTFWPEHLTVFYPYPSQWPLLLAMGATIAVLVVSWAAWHWGRRWPFLISGWFWFLGTLVPVIGLVQVGDQAMADRYVYVPLIGIFVIISWGGAELCRIWNVPAVGRGAAAGLVLAVLAIVARQQLAYWQNSETLFKHAIAITRNNYTAEYNLGYYFQGKGEKLEAAKYYRAAIRLNPTMMNPHMNLGVVLERLGLYAESAQELGEAVRLAPRDVGVHFDLGCVFVELGNRDQAISEFKEALRLNPDLKLAKQRLEELAASSNP